MKVCWLLRAQTNNLTSVIVKEEVNLKSCLTPLAAGEHAAGHLKQRRETITQLLVSLAIADKAFWQNSRRHRVYR